MIVVVPPKAAARVPVSKESDAEVPPKGSIHGGVDVDGAGEDVLTLGVDLFVGLPLL